MGAAALITCRLAVPPSAASASPITSAADVVEEGRVAVKLRVGAFAYDEALSVVRVINLYRVERQRFPTGVV